MKVSEAMHREYPMVRPDESVQAAAQTLAESDGHALLVLSEDERLLGIVTERDITVRAVADGKSAGGTPIHEIMSSELFTCGPEDDAADLAAALSERQIEQAPVLDGDKLVGLLILADLAAKFAAAETQPSAD
jgi:CBS domain-containing protein